MDELVEITPFPPLACPVPFQSSLPTSSLKKENTYTHTTSADVINTNDGEIVFSASLDAKRNEVWNINGVCEALGALLPGKGAVLELRPPSRRAAEPSAPSVVVHLGTCLLPRLC